MIFHHFGNQSHVVVGGESPLVSSRYSHLRCDSPIRRELTRPRARPAEPSDSMSLIDVEGTVLSVSIVSVEGRLPEYHVDTR